MTRLFLYETQTTMGFLTHVRMPSSEFFIKILLIVSVLAFSVQSEKTYVNRGESTKKIKNEEITVPLANNIWKPYTPAGMLHIGCQPSCSLWFIAK